MLPRLKELRRAKNISQKQLADMLQLTQQSINKYENHSVQPDLQTLIRLADYFDVSIDYLVGYTDYPQPHSPEGTQFSKEDFYFLSFYKQLTEEQKTSIQIILKNFYLLNEAKP